MSASCITADKVKKSHIPSILQVVYGIESVCYPREEAASFDSLKLRLEEAPEFFMLMTRDDGSTSPNSFFPSEAGDIMGYVCGTLTKGESLEEESMSSHLSDGSVLCIHSVATRLDLRRQGVARSMMSQYTRHVAENSPQVKCISLISKKTLVPFYASCGFSLIGRSSIEHGQETWYEMALAPGTTPVACVDAFICSRGGSNAFSGNPAAVTWVPEFASPDASWMQNVAQQFNLSETAFVRPLDGLDAFKTLPTDTAAAASMAAVSNLLNRVKSAAVSGTSASEANLVFQDIIAVIDDAFIHHPTEFQNNEVRNPVDSNQGSCKVLALAATCNLTKDEALLLWGEHYDSVASEPEGSSHANIRALIKGSLSEVNFPNSFPLELRLKAGGAKDPTALDMLRSRYSLRWFTPNKEVDLCGHATLGAAFALWHCPGDTRNQRVHPTKLVFVTEKRGELVVERDLERPSKLTMDFPQCPPHAVPEVPEEIVKGLGVSADSVVYYGSNDMDVIVEVEPSTFMNVGTPDFAELSKVETRCIILTSRATDGASQFAEECGMSLDIVSRVFVPRYDVDEDPVTGSAHCGLGPYWGSKLQKETLVAMQCSKRRGILHLELHNSTGRISISGDGRTSWSGLLHSKPAL